MGMNKEDAITKMNHYGQQGIPFVFLVDFDMNDILVLTIDEAKDRLLYSIPSGTNIEPVPIIKKEVEWHITPVSYEKYAPGFEVIKSHILNGDTYLLNYTQPTKVSTNFTLEEIFSASSAPYKVHLKGCFTCFSPEIFVRIQDRKISSFPMKGTIDVAVDNARVVLKNDRKELAEHNTIVDLIRNDISIVANQVEVEKFRYIDHIETNQKDLLQMSSQISGILPENYPEHIGSILFSMLPAGSITGAPKPKTLEIIKKAEKYNRGYYTGVFGLFDGRSLDSCVLIRFIENQDGQLVYKSGGGITFLSNCQAEYEELIKKVYVPII